MTVLPKVTLIGRTNVGKSALFNRLSEGTKALVSDIPGTTRDRKEAICHWHGKTFLLIDTGGLDFLERSTLEQAIWEQAETAIKQSALLLFVVDSRQGVTPRDKQLALKIKRSRRPVLLIANKADSQKFADMAAEFYALGLGEPLVISAATGRGSGDLLDLIMKKIKARGAENPATIPVAIVGKPNVGKSSLVNALVGEERVIVDSEPYTTRDSNDIPLRYKGKQFVIIDTAGLRKKPKINPKSLEYESADQSRRSISRAAIVLLVTDSHQSLASQDKHLAELIGESQASAIIIGNKWDLAENRQEYTEYQEYYRRYFNFIDWAPVLLLSAKNKTKMTKLKETLLAVYQERFRQIDDNALDKFLQRLVKKHKPTKGTGNRYPYIYSLRQVGVNPPQFVVKIGANTNLHVSYLRFIIKELRLKFGFAGTPLKIWIEKRKII